jgi:hypothetical protein
MYFTRKIYQRFWNASDKYISSNIFFRKTSFLVLFISVMLSIIAGGRLLGTDRDYFSYQTGWLEISQGYAVRWEPFFTLVASSVQTMFGDDSFHIFLFVVAFISMNIKLYLFSNRNHFALVGFIYLVMLFPSQEMMQMRVCLALAFAYLGLYKATFDKTHILERLIYIILALSSHISTFVIAPFILMPKIAHSRNILFILLIGVMPFLLFSGLILIMAEYFDGTALGGLLQFYTNTELLDVSISRPNPFSSRSITFILLIIIGFYNLKIMPEEALPWFYISFFGIISFYSLFSFPVIAHRLFELTMFSNLVWVTSLKGTSKKLSLILLILFGLYSFFTLFIMDGYYHHSVV